MDDLSGRIVKSYHIAQQLDSGGFGAVYRAYQPIIEREVALKVILPRFANEVEFIRRFEVEAQTVARLEHPYIVPLYDFWRDPEGAFLVMRLMRGGSLRDLIKHGALPVETALGYLEQVAAALSMAHRHNIIHRDIKPENILLDEEGNAYLTDFGIAQKYDVDVDSGEIDSIAGSVNYIAPDLIRGNRPSPQSDVYALGIMVFEMLAGQLPYEMTAAPAMLMNHLHKPLPDLQLFAPYLPDTINQVLQRACSKDPDDRYETVRDFARALRGVTGAMSPSLMVATTEMYRLIENPYKGLRPFDEADSQDFFGREDLVEQLINRLNEDAHAANFLAVVGPSGSGKSSVVRAGLIPQMRFGAVAETYNWLVADFVPSNDPIGNLANALLKIAPNPLPNLVNRLKSDADAVVWAAETILDGTYDGRVLIFIDQFEELFTQTESDETRRHVLKLLSTAIQKSPDVFLIVTIRADFFDRPLLYEGIGDLIQSRTQVVLPLSAHEIERAITGPAENANLLVERELVAAIVSDVREEPGALPLLQYTLTELFERRETNRLTLSSYIDSGGVLSALARRAQDVYDDFPTQDRQVARQIFLRLVTLGEGTEDTRRRTKRAELFDIGYDKETINDILDQFGKFRLLTFDRDPVTREPTVEIAHEALIKRWDDFQQWLDESRNDVRLQRSLSVATREWQVHGQQVGYLLYGARLLQYEEWESETTVLITEQERQFLAESITEKKKREEEEQQRQQREAALQQRVLNRTRWLAVMMAFAVIITIGFSIFSFLQSQNAQLERDNAQSARATSEVNESNAQARAEEIQNLNLVNVAQQAVQNGDSGLAVTLLQTVTTTENLSSTVQSVLYDTAYNTQVRNRLSGHTDKVTAIAINSDGSVIATGSEDLTIILWDTTSNDVIGTLVGHRGLISDLTFSPDGRQLVSVGNDAVVIVWDVDSQTSTNELRGHRNVITGVAFAPNGQQIVTSSGDDTLIIWDLASGNIQLQLEGHTDSVRAVDYSPDGTEIVSASRDGTLIVWDVATGSPLRTFTGHTESVQTVEYSPDGTRIISGSFDRSVILWDAQSATIMTRFVGHSDQVTSVAFNPDGSLAVSTSCAERDIERACTRGEVLLWDIELAREINELTGHIEIVNTGIFTPDGNSVITGSCGMRRDGSCISGEALIWDIVIADDVFQQLTEHNSGVFSVAYSAETQRLLSGGGSVLLDDQPQGDTSILLWDTTTGRVLERFEGHTANVNELIFHPNGLQFISASRDTTVRIWSFGSNTPDRTFEGHSSTVHDIELTRDASHVFSAGNDRVLLWDIRSLEIELVLENFGSQISARAIAISPDDRILATGLNNGVIILWSGDTGEEIRRLTGHTDDVLSLEFNSDGTQLVSSSNDRSIRLWDITGGREIRFFASHLAPVTDVTLTPDDRYIVSASEDNTVRYWDVDSGEVIRVFAEHTGAVNDNSISSDGTVAYSASADGTLIGWRISYIAVREWLEENRYSRELTQREIDRYIIPLTD